jgi:hypothetical protein
VKAAERDVYTVGAKVTSQVKRTCELICLYPDEADQTLITVASKSADDALKGDRCSGFVIGLDLDFSIVAENPSLV